MQLVVHVTGLEESAGELRYELNRFEDQNKVAARIARAVRNWIRVVPVRQSGSRLKLSVTAEWIEDVPHVPEKIPKDVPKVHVQKRKKRSRK